MSTAYQHGCGIMSKGATIEQSLESTARTIQHKQRHELRISFISFEEKIHDVIVLLLWEKVKRKERTLP